VGFYFESLSLQSSQPRAILPDGGGSGCPRGNGGLPTSRCDLATKPQALCSNNIQHKCERGLEEVRRVVWLTRRATTDALRETNRRRLGRGLNLTPHGHGRRRCWQWRGRKRLQESDRWIWQEFEPLLVEDHTFWTELKSKRHFMHNLVLMEQLSCRKSPNLSFLLCPLTISVVLVLVIAVSCWPVHV
jgi:hypothetical protein